MQDASTPVNQAPAVGSTICGLTAGNTSNCFTVTYSNQTKGMIGAGVPGQINPVAPHVLRWIQFVCTDSPTTSAAGATASACPPEAGTYLDPFERSYDTPFYYDETEQRNFSSAGDMPPMNFNDKPRRELPASRATVNWRAHLFLAEWNGVIPNPAVAGGANGEVVIHDGIEWGFQLSCVTIHQPVGIYIRAGVDGDKPLSEQSGIDPLRPIPKGCQSGSPSHTQPRSPVDQP
jgi:hypothetical protein